jgi:hypothetical protein
MDKQRTMDKSKSKGKPVVEDKAKPVVKKGNKRV